MSSLLRLRNLRKTVDGRALLDIAEFAIPQRSCIVLSGRNGAGKTTLLKILAGLEEADAATIIIKEIWERLRETHRLRIVK